MPRNIYTREDAVVSPIASILFQKNWQNSSNETRKIAQKPLLTDAHVFVPKMEWIVRLRSKLLCGQSVILSCGMVHTQMWSERPSHPFDTSRYRYTHCVDIRRKLVLLGAGLRGMPVFSGSTGVSLPDYYQPICELISARSDPFHKACYVSVHSDIDRVLMEMTMVQRREFMWCYVNGLAHILGENCGVCCMK